MNQSVASPQSTPAAASPVAENNKLKQLIARATVDAEYRRRVVANPVASLVECIGTPMPTGLTVAFVEGTTARTIVLPAFTGEQPELDDDALASVAGGVSIEELTVVGVITAATAVLYGAGRATLAFLDWATS